MIEFFVGAIVGATLTLFIIASLYASDDNMGRPA